LHTKNTNQRVNKTTFKNSRENLRTVKTHTVILVYRRNLVALKINSVHTVVNWCALCFICVCISLS